MTDHTNSGNAATKKTMKALMYACIAVGVFLVSSLVVGLSIAIQNKADNMGDLGQRLNYYFDADPWRIVGLALGITLVSMFGVFKQRR